MRPIAAAHASEEPQTAANPVLAKIDEIASPPGTGRDHKVDIGFARDTGLPQQGADPIAQFLHAGRGLHHRRIAGNGGSEWRRSGR